MTFGGMFCTPPALIERFMGEPGRIGAAEMPESARPRNELPFMLDRLGEAGRSGVEEGVERFGMFPDREGEANPRIARPTRADNF